MRGEVLHYDEGQGFGFITGADGNRYTFAREDMRRDVPIGKGVVVEFQPSGGQARDVFAIRAQLGTGVPSISPIAQQQAGNDTAGTQPPQVRAVPPQEGDLGLWSYFWRGLTQNYGNFRGRARRKEYWAFYLFWLIGLVAVLAVALTLDGALGNLDRDMPAFAMAGAGLFVLATFLPGLAMTIRRQHDIGLSGWFYLLVFIPYVGHLIIFVFSLIPSQKHENRWGPVPAGVRV